MKVLEITNPHPHYSLQKNNPKLTRVRNIEMIVFFK